MSFCVVFSLFTESFGQCTNLIQLVYGKSTPTSATLSKEVQDSSDSDESDDDEFFRAKVEGNKVCPDIICVVIS